MSARLSPLPGAGAGAIVASSSEERRREAQTPHNPGAGLEDDEGECDLQAQAPGYGPNIDRVPAGRSQVGDTQDHDQADQRLGLGRNEANGKSDPLLAAAIGSGTVQHKDVMQ